MLSVNNTQNNHRYSTSTPSFSSNIQGLRSHIMNIGNVLSSPFRNHTQNSQKQAAQTGGDHFTDYLSLPNGSTIHAAPTKVTAHFHTKIDRFIPEDSEKKVVKDQHLSSQFNCDVHRGKYQIAVSNKSVIRIKSESDLIKHVGLEDAKRIAEIASQAHLADPTSMVMKTMVEDNFPRPNDEGSKIDIVKADDNDYIIRSSVGFHVQSGDVNKTLPLINIHVYRTTTLQRTIDSENGPKDDFTMIVSKVITNS